MAESAVEAVGSRTEIPRPVTDGEESDPSGTKDVLAAEDKLSEDTLHEEVFSEEAFSAFDPGTETDEEDSDESGQEC